jgi:hypothetical protein
MVDTNTIGRSVNGYTSNRKEADDLMESNSSRDVRRSSESVHSEGTSSSSDRLKTQFDAAVQLILNLPQEGNF